MAVDTLQALGNVVSAVGSAASDIITSLGQALGNIIVAIGDLTVDILGAIGNIVSAIGTAVSDIITALGGLISDVLGAIGNVITALGEGISNVILEVSRIPGIIVDLFESLLKRLFVPEDGYYSGKIDTLKTDLNNKIPYQSYQNNLKGIGEAGGSGQNNITTSVDLNNYKLSDRLTISMSNFIDFSIFSQYRDIWFTWVRVVVYILLTIYWINETIKFLRGFSIAGGSSAYINQNNNQGGNS